MAGLASAQWPHTAFLLRGPPPSRSSPDAVRVASHPIPAPSRSRTLTCRGWHPGTRQGVGRVPGLARAAASGTGAGAGNEGSDNQISHAELAQDEGDWEGEGGGDEDGKFLELEEEMAEGYGPPALLLLGVTEADRRRVKQALGRSGADFVAVASVSERMMGSLTLWDAMQEASLQGRGEGSSDEGEGASAPAAAPQVLLAGSLEGGSASGVAQGVGVCLMSGLTGEECMTMVDIVEQELSHLGHSGLAFAAMLPGFSQRPLKDVVSDILGDHATYATPSSSLA